jgi:hypothetical protein
MGCSRTLTLPVRATKLPAVLAIRDWCWPAQERSWALKQVSLYYLADAARLRERSDNLIARSRRLRIRLA